MPEAMYEHASEEQALVISLHCTALGRDHRGIEAVLVRQAGLWDRGRLAMMMLAT